MSWVTLVKATAEALAALLIVEKPGSWFPSRVDYGFDGRLTLSAQQEAH